MIRLLTDGKNLIIEFKYDPEIVSKVKSLPNRIFEPVAKKWILPLTINDFFEFRKTFPLSEIDKSVREFDFDKKEEPVLSYEPPHGLTPYKHQIETFKSAVKTIKLQQAASGYVYDDIGRTITLSEHNKKIEALIEIIREEFGRAQVVVYAYFKNQIDAVSKALQKELEIVTVFGGGADNRRAVENFKSGAAQVLVANPASVGTGMNFTNAKGIIWFAPIWDYEIFDQSRSRVHRIGLDHKSIEVFMHAKGTIEYSMYWGLRHKKDLSAIILRSIKEKNKTKRLQGIYGS